MASHPENLRQTDTKDTPKSPSPDRRSAKKDAELIDGAKREKQRLDRENGWKPHDESIQKIQASLERLETGVREPSSENNPLEQQKGRKDEETAEQRDTGSAPETRSGKRGDSVGQLTTSFYDHDKLYERLITHMQQEDRKAWHEIYNGIKHEYEEALIQAAFKDRSSSKDKYKTRDGEDPRNIAKHRMKEAIDKFTQLLGRMLEAEREKRINRSNSSFKGKFVEYEDVLKNMPQEMQKKYESIGRDIQDAYENARAYAESQDSSNPLFKAIRNAAENDMRKIIVKVTETIDDMKRNKRIDELKDDSVKKGLLELRDACDDDIAHALGLNVEHAKATKNEFDHLIDHVLSLPPEEHKIGLKTLLLKADGIIGRYTKDKSAQLTSRQQEVRVLPPRSVHELSVTESFDAISGDEAMKLGQRVDKLKEDLSDHFDQFNERKPDILKEREEAYELRVTQIKDKHKEAQTYIESDNLVSGERLMQEVFYETSDVLEDIERDKRIDQLEPSIRKRVLEMKNEADRDPRYKNDPSKHKSDKSQFNDQLDRFMNLPLDRQEEGLQVIQKMAEYSGLIRRTGGSSQVEEIE